MAHEVTFSLPERTLGKLDIVFQIRRDEVLLGTLRVSKGGVDWFSAKKQLGFGFDWTQIDQLFQSKGDKRRRRPR